jgi:iron(III) transport system permease protein
LAGTYRTNLNKRKNGNGYGISSWFSRNIFVIILAILILVFVAFPVISVLLKSADGEGGATLQYYRELFNKDMFDITVQSLLLAAASSIIGTVLAYILSLGVYVSSPWLRNAMKKVLLITIISPPFVTSIVMILLFGRRGFITYDLFNLNWNIYGWQGILLIQVLSTLSFAMLILSNSFDSIDERAVTASLDLGVTPIQTFKNIVIPNTMPGILSVLFILFTMNFADFGTPVIIGGRFQTLATEAYNAVLSTGDLNRGAAMSTVMVLPSILAFIFYSQMMKKVGTSNFGDKGISNSTTALKLPKCIKILLEFSLVLFIVFNLLKYSTIVLSTVTNNATGKLRFTLDNFSKLEPVSISAFQRSIFYSLIASVLAVIIGTSLSYYIYRLKRRNIKTLEFIASLPYIIPGTFFGLGYLVAFNNKPIFLTGSAAIVILNLAFRQISVANKNANSTYPNIDAKLESAGKDLGANKFQLLKTVIIPMSIPIFTTSFAQIFTSSMTAFGSVMFLVSPGKLLASTEMFRQIKGGGNAVGSILAVFIILITGFVNVLMTNILKKVEGK